MKNPKDARRRRVAAVLMLTAAVLVAGQLPVVPASADPAGTITNGRVTLGVNREGNLITPAENIGITFEPSGNDGIAPGCACEAWGAGDETTGTSGSAGRDTGVYDVEVISNTRTATTSVSVVAIPSVDDATLHVTHDFHPSASDDLFEAAVTIQNVSDDPVVPRYRRAMDWDIGPTEFDEVVTIQGTEAADTVVFASDDGFASGDPFAGESWINFVGDAVDNFDEVLTPGGSGPDSDHGALFDFRFATLAPGESMTFNIYYGAAANEADANAALSAVGAEVYSFGQPSSQDGPELGVPNTFIFAFRGVGGLVQFPSAQFSASAYSGAEGTDATIEVVLSGPTANEVRVDYATSAGSATPGEDYTETSGTLTIPVGSDRGSFSVPLLTDAVADDGETVDLALANPVGGTIGERATAVLTITDVAPADPTAPPTDPAGPGGAPSARPATPVSARPGYTG